MPNRFFLATAAAVTLFVTPLAAQEESSAAQDVGADTVVATVNGVEITVGHLIIARATLPQQYQQLPPEVLFPGILEQLIQQSALAQTFEGDRPARIDLSLENEERSLLAGEVIEGIMATAVSEEDVQAAYEQNYANAAPEEEYNASHILVETEEAAQSIKDELDGGADFAELAREKSTGPSGPGGGSLGWFGSGMMVAPFEAAVIALEVGQVSEPVQTQFGWHVIKLNETRNKDVPPLDEVREELTLQLQQDAVQASIEEVTAAATVERMDEGIDPTVLNNLDLLEN